MTEALVSAGVVQSTPNRGPQGDNRGPGQAGRQAPTQGSAQVAPNSGPQGDNRGRGQITGGQVPRGGGPESAPSSPNRGPQRGPGQFAQGRGNVAGPVEHGPREFEKRAFQRNLTAPRRFQVGAFRPPPGWQYRQWTYGEYLPPMFWAQMYWIANFWLYDLDRPPLGCEWVRSGADALLVDTSTGEILEVVYNVFY